jgi:hypothetical protein
VEVGVVAGGYLYGRWGVVVRVWQVGTPAAKFGLGRLSDERVWASATLCGHYRLRTRRLTPKLLFKICFEKIKD